MTHSTHITLATPFTNSRLYSVNLFVIFRNIFPASMFYLMTLSTESFQVTNSIVTHIPVFMMNHQMRGRFASFTKGLAKLTITAVVV